MSAPVMSPTVSSWKDSPKVMLPWKTVQMFLPHRLRRKIRSKLRSRMSPTSSITTLKRSWSPSDTLKTLNAHRWTIWDAQYLFMGVLGILSLCIIHSPGPLAKACITIGLLALLLFPITCQFFLPAMPIISWLVLFYAMQFIPSDWRPPIWVRVLPALENIFYGANLSNILSAHKNTFLDLAAWLPYGICHYGAPAVVSLILFIWGPPGITPCFARSFGYMNIVGVTIQFFFPCSPPWYELMYGLAPAHYGMPGSPAGLARIDKLFGIDLYTSGFTASPVPFGAFPSLHAGNAILEALFMSWVFPRLRPLWIVYTAWLWWATMYLSHHYAVDVIGGAILAAVAFYWTRAKFLPRMQPDKKYRWDYDYVEIGEVPVDPYGYELARFDYELDSDEWTVGSSSSVSSGSLSPVDENQSLWDGETLGSGSDLELGR